MDFGWLWCVSLDQSVVAKEGMWVLGGSGVWGQGLYEKPLQLHPKKKSQWNTDKILMKTIYPNDEML